MLVQPETTREEITPAVYSTITKWVLEAPARAVPQTLPASTRELPLTEVARPASVQAREVEATTAALREEWLGEQEGLLHGHLLAWFEPFEQACRAADPFGFYGASARLLGVFLKMDANYLSLVKPAKSAD